MLEFQAFKLAPHDTTLIGLSAPPGTVHRDAAGRATLLHFAPSRFLVPAPTLEMARKLDVLQAAGVGIQFDVDGKWQRFTLTGPGSERVLSSAINLARVLADRGCAAVRLFDCPVVLAWSAGKFEMWVAASYATALRNFLNDIRVSV